MADVAAARAKHGGRRRERRGGILGPERRRRRMVGAVRSKRLRSGVAAQHGGAVMGRETAAEEEEEDRNSDRAQQREAVMRGAMRGVPSPLGPSRAAGGGVNFAVYSRNATSMALVVYRSGARGAAPRLLGETAMFRDDESLGVWHVALPALPEHGIEYGVRVSGGHADVDWRDGNRWDSSKVLLDPYAPLVRCGRRAFGVRDAAAEDFDAERGGGSSFRGAFDLRGREFDWGGNAYKRPNIAWEDLVIYEMAVRSFTADASSTVTATRRGTYRGIIDKIGHFLELGVNAVELLPVFEYDELEFQRTPNPRDHMVNAWGYSHISFFAPMSRFASDPTNASDEFKEMVRELHRNGIEVIVDVVYNHTAEGGDDDPYVLSMRGIDNRTYYLVDGPHGDGDAGTLMNFSGCGNSINANHPEVSRLIIASLRHWVEEYHVDGFRFDLASALTRDERGEPMPAPPLIRDISNDPVLASAKLIAEPWDCGGLYQVGSFPSWDRWGEWNGMYRDAVRKFVRGDAGMKKEVATRMCGSSDLYNDGRFDRKPYHSINFVIAHDGFTLWDLVAYERKRNDDNGEQSRDGCNDNFGWNCGAEGETDDAGVLQLRWRQMRNFHVALMCSQGTPMVHMGDEYGHTRFGNNNSYGHDNHLNHFQWGRIARGGDADAKAFMRFFASLIKFRRDHAPMFGRARFLNNEDVSWHGHDWDNDESKYIGMVVKDHSGAARNIFVALNAHAYALSLSLPAPFEGKAWHRIVDTSLASPDDFDGNGIALDVGPSNVYEMAAHSALILRSQ